ncbi:hypothetical protein MP228_009737 [Amoeboaphelidium protococcarum]|nr:hypothetical protein MP228_009737 [Amoeboaphelidium protococcarum]
MQTEVDASVAAVSNDKDNQVIAYCGLNKVLRLQSLSNNELIKETDVPKKLINLIFTADDDKLLMGDKFGDVYSLSVKDPDAKLELVLGHVSLLTDILLSRDEKYLLTADRDKKIRVSSYPDCYNIHGFCLSHTAYVRCMVQIPEQKLLISAGGDGRLILWDYVKCQVLCDIPLFEDNDSFLHIRQILLSLDSKFCLVVYNDSAVINVYQVDVSGQQLSFHQQIQLNGKVVSLDSLHDNAFIASLDAEPYMVTLQSDEDQKFSVSDQQLYNQLKDAIKFNVQAMSNPFDMTLYLCGIDDRKQVEQQAERDRTYKKMKNQK